MTTFFNYDEDNINKRKKIFIFFVKKSAYLKEKILKLLEVFDCIVFDREEEGNNVQKAQENIETQKKYLAEAKNASA